MQTIGKDINVLLGVGNNILKLKRELAVKVGREEFEEAISIRN